MGNPWDVRSPSHHGDHDPTILHAAVGRALSAWELLELDWARVYSVFIWKHPYEAVHEPQYKNARIFRERMGIIDTAAKTYFMQRPNQESEGEYDRLKDETVHLADRRNDIAHGLVTNVGSVSYNTAEVMQGKFHPLHMLCPAMYRSKQYITAPPKLPFPGYSWTADDIDAYSRSFTDWRPKILSFFVRIRDERQASPDKPA